MEWVAVTATVPADRVVEFYSRHTSWLDGIAEGTSPAGDSPDVLAWGSEPDDGDRACLVWSRLSAPAKGLLSALMVEPGRKVNSAQLADQLGIDHGMYGVAGVLAWPTRHAAKVGRGIPVQFEYGVPGEGASYWMDETTAELFRRAAEHADQEG